VTNNAEMRRSSIEFEKGERLRIAIRVNEMGFAASDDDKVALDHAELSSLFERERG